MATKNVVITAITVEVRCPHCDGVQLAPDGAEVVDVSTAKEMCTGDRTLCSACDEPIRLLWNDKAVTG